MVYGGHHISWSRTFLPLSFRRTIKTLRVPCLICLLLCTATVLTLSGQERPKIGLVLSGGGAKGIAHIGVLKAMEEAGLTPDYITGTSMGSIVGGLYAAGYTADELRELVSTADWSSIITNKIPFNKVTFEEKDYYDRYLLEFYFQNRQFILPKGVIEGQAMIDLFSHLTRHVHHINQFDELPIPYACIATDIVTGEKVVLDHGSLAMSMRASMAIPSVFTPVRIDDKLLVDGGLVHNLPVDEALDMGADIIIGVFVGGGLESEENLNSAISILTQSAFITSAIDAEEQSKKCDILIYPDIDAIGAGSFAMAPEILTRGDQAGQEYYGVFKELADSLNQFGPAETITRIPLHDQYAFDTVVVKGNKIFEEDFIIGKLDLHKETPTSIQFLEEQLSLIYGTQHFERISYEILGEEQHRELWIDIVEKPRTQFRFSYHYDSENKGGILGNITLRNRILNRSRLIFEADLSANPQLYLNYFKYLGRRQDVAFQGSFRYRDSDLSLFDSLGRETSVFNSFVTSASLGFQTTSFQNMAFGLDLKWTQVNLKPSITTGEYFDITRIQSKGTSLELYYRLNTTNTRYFPTRGTVFEARASTSINLDGTITIRDSFDVTPGDLEDIFQSKIQSFDVTYTPYIPLGHDWTVTGKVRLALSNLNAGQFNLTEYDHIGGFIPAGLNTHEYYGSNSKEFALSNYFYGRLGIQYQWHTNIYLNAAVNVLSSSAFVSWLNPSVELGQLGDRDTRWGSALSVGYRSPVGPVMVALAKDHNRSGLKATFVVGFYF